MPTIKVTKVEFEGRIEEREVIVEEEHVHGRGNWRHLDFYEVQKQRAVELTIAICERFDIPKRLPTMGGAATTCLAPRGFCGACGHYHLSVKKPDPGLSLWPKLKKSFGP